MENTIKRRLYEIIEASREKDTASRAYDAMILVAVVVGLIPLTMKSENVYTTLIDILTILIFAVDYLLRFYTADYKMGIKSYKAYVAYTLTPLAIVDLLSIVPVLMFVFPHSMFFRMFRLFRVTLVFKFARYSKVMTTITNVIRKVKSQLFAVLILTLVYIVASAMIMFQVEPDSFPTFFDAVYWATVSITTIGYGDILPITVGGRLITMISSLVGVAVIALPSGIITAAYMDEIKKKKGRFEL